MPPGHPIILLKSNLFNMAAVSVKMSIRSVITHVSEQIGLPLRGRQILLHNRTITDRIGLHSVPLPLSMLFNFVLHVLGIERNIWYK